MARAALQLCNALLLLGVCENRSCELAGDSELKFFHILTPEGFFGKFVECCLALFDGSEFACLKETFLFPKLSHSKSEFPKFRALGEEEF